MQKMSVVIVCKNAGKVISPVLKSLQGLTDDIIVYDNGSTDDTLVIVKQFPVQVHQGKWEGFGQTKRKANALARYDWILSLDADEAIDEELRQSLLAVDLSIINTVYDIPFRNFFGTDYLKYGEWGGDHHIRLFNRSVVNWNEAPVHEELLLPADCRIEKLKGFVLHRTADDIKEYEVKLMKYATLNADKYFAQGKKAGAAKKYAAAFFSFVQNYVFRLGFLDGRPGYQCAVLMARYTFTKYKKLEELSKKRSS
jgi:glycosyltransferase involved in cell wall biosynthesis